VSDQGVSKTAPLLSIEGLHVSFSTRDGTVEALRGIDLAVSPGETLGVVGESGSGKSVTAYAATRLLDAAGRVTAGSIKYDGEDVTRLSAKRMRALHGASISMIFQNPRGALNPIRSVGDQIADAILAHRRLARNEARAEALGLLQSVLIREPHKRIDAYPHELSGGMCQRVMIAMAIACAPKLLIADEPTTGLDVTTQKAVMDLIARITRDRGMAMILITHDLGLAARYCDRISVMERGRVVEAAAPGALFSAPRHPYTRKLVAASPTKTSTIADLARDDSAPMAGATSRTERVLPTGSVPLLAVRDLVKTYDRIVAVGGVSFDLRPGESVGLVGESGSGKSTISRLICRLIDPSSGTIQFDGHSIGDVAADQFHRSAFRKDIQIVFQDPTDSLNPRYTAFDSIAHPLRRLAHLSDGDTLRRRVSDCAQRAGLGLDLLARFPHQLSGGQKARVGIARAIACAPKLLVLDEPTAALDVSVQAIILQLLDRLRREEGLGFLFVSHDINVVRMMCERAIVLREGRIVEEGPSAALFEAPHEAYTRELVAAVPHFEPGIANGN
jgi:peptide/nickel transport system ATP-binding protein